VLSLRCAVFMSAVWFSIEFLVAAFHARSCLGVSHLLQSRRLHVCAAE
jgi:hypothetical protein